MDNKILRAVQLYQLEILIEVDKICTKHGIKYYMIGGTLLGSVRHKGFIPWDDDLDIAMTRDEYDRFTEVCKSELPNHLFLQNTLNDGLWMFITKIRLNNSRFEDDITVTSKCHNGIYIDIFPLDKVPEHNSVLLQYRYEVMRLMSSVAAFKNGKRNYKSKGVKAISWLLSPLSFAHIYKIAMRGITCYNKTNSKYVTSFMSNYGYKKQRMNYKDVYGSGTELEFEGHRFIAPSNWQANLEQLFGDYMELPPEDKRGDRHKRLRVVLPDGREWNNE